MHPRTPRPPAPCGAFKRRTASSLSIIIAVLGSGWEAPAQAMVGAVSHRFEELREQNLRVASVAYRLSIANRAVCRGGLAPQPGFVPHSLEQYDPTDREEAARSFDLALHVGVMDVVEGSPAQKAGLASGDSLLTVNGKDLDDVQAATDGQPRRAMVDRVQQILLVEMRKGEVMVRVSRPEGVRDVRFIADMGCPSNVELVAGDEVNAWADGTRVMVSSAILSRSVTDDDLALVVAHEMAHNILRHSPRPAGTGASQAEEQADRLAVAMVAEASYDLSGAEEFLRRLTAPVAGVSLAATHPQPDRRLALLRAEIAVATALPGRLPAGIIQMQEPFGQGLLVANALLDAEAEHRPDRPGLGQYVHHAHNSLEGGDDDFVVKGSGNVDAAVGDTVVERRR